MKALKNVPLSWIIFVFSTASIQFNLAHVLFVEDDSPKADIEVNNKMETNEKNSGDDGQSKKVPDKGEVYYAEVIGFDPFTLIEQIDRAFYGGLAEDGLPTENNKAESGSIWGFVLSDEVPERVEIDSLVSGGLKNMEVGEFVDKLLVYKHDENNKEPNQHVNTPMQSYQQRHENNPLYAKGDEKMKEFWQQLRGLETTNNGFVHANQNRKKSDFLSRSERSNDDSGRGAQRDVYNYNPNSQAIAQMLGLLGKMEERNHQIMIAGLVFISFAISVIVMSMLICCCYRTDRQASKEQELLTEKPKMFSVI